MDSKHVDAVLIDDDELVHMTWKLLAKKRGKTLLCFKDANSFFAVAFELARNVPIYVDSNLGAGVKGEDVSRQIFEIGFIEIYLATGYSPDSFPPMPWIKAVVGKEWG